MRESQKESIQRAGLDINKITDEQADLITQPSDAPENYYQDGQLSPYKALRNWKQNLELAGLTRAEITLAIRMNFSR